MGKGGRKGILVEECRRKKEEEHGKRKGEEPRPRGGA